MNRRYLDKLQPIKRDIENTIYATCERYKLKFDKSMLDYQYNNFHFHSQKCLDKFIKTLHKEEASSHFSSKDDDWVYDPMEDF